MNCLSDGVLQAYLDGELSPDEHTAAERHLAECDSCRLRSRQHQDALAALRADLARLDPPEIEVPDWNTVLHQRTRERSRREPARITWLQSLIGVAAAAALWFAFFPADRKPPTANNGLDRLIAQLPPLGEDPQRMWREQAVVITVVNKTTGSIDRFITSSAGDRVVRESFGPSHNNIEDSSIPRRGI
jgi:hypothetical protein